MIFESVSVKTWHIKSMAWSFQLWLLELIGALRAKMFRAFTPTG